MRSERRSCSRPFGFQEMTDDAEPTTVERETERRDQNAGEENSQHNRNDVQHNRLWNNRTESGSRNKDKDGQRPSLTGGSTPRTKGGRMKPGYELRHFIDDRKKGKDGRRAGYTGPVKDVEAKNKARVSGGGSLSAGPDILRILGGRFQK